METTLTTIDISQYQSVDGIPWNALIEQGLSSVIVRLSHGLTADPRASDFIKNASSLGLIVHGYHFYEGKIGEISFSVRNAMMLGLPNGAHFFLDMEGNIPGNWQDILYTFAPEWLRNGWKPGLYCSDSPYKARFDNAKLVADKITRWIVSYSYEPKNYDVWQYSSSNGVLDLDHDATGVLAKKYDDMKHKPDSKGDTEHITPESPVTPTDKGFVGISVDTRLGGGKTIGYSPNGRDFYAAIWPGGFAFNEKAGQDMWPFIKDKVEAAAKGQPLSWSKITDKPDIALKDDLVPLATKDDVKNIEKEPGPPGQTWQPYVADDGNWHLKLISTGGES